jgi:hypothetical protein
MKKGNYKELSYLAGFHLKKPDYNFKSISGELFNIISDVTKREFDVFDLDTDLMILKSKEAKFFEIRFDSKQLIYVDEADDFNSFQSKAFSILQAWQKLNPSAKILKLGGVMRKILLSEEHPKGVYNSILFNNYIKNLNVGGKNKEIHIHLNYDYSRKGKEYNMNIYLDEDLGVKYQLGCRLDINQIDTDGTKRIDFERVKEIFSFADKYYKEEFFDDLNIK